MARRPSKQPTDGELEILKVLWEQGPSGLGRIHATLQDQRPIAATTVATVLKMMLDKDLVEREDGPKGYLWSARLSRTQAVSGLIGKLVDHVFDGSARRLVAHLIEQGQLDARERDELRDLLESSKKQAATKREKGSNR